MYLSDYTPEFVDDMFAPWFVNEWNRMWFNFDAALNRAFFQGVRDTLDQWSGDDTVLRHFLSFVFAIPFALVLGTPIIVLLYMLSHLGDIRYRIQEGKSYRRAIQAKAPQKALTATHRPKVMVILPARTMKALESSKAPSEHKKEVILMPEAEPTSDFKSLSDEAGAKIRALIHVYEQPAEQTTDEHIRQLDELLDMDGPYTDVVYSYDKKTLDALNELRDELQSRLLSLS